MKTPPEVKGNFLLSGVAEMSGGPAFFSALAKCSRS
jgi:hypothetical protein